MREKTWKMPVWMRPYRHLLAAPRCFTIEEIVNWRVNLNSSPERWLLQVRVVQQIQILTLLHQADKLK